MHWECCFGVMTVEWYGVCNYVVFSVVEIYLTMVVCICSSLLYGVVGVWCSGRVV